MSPLAALLPRAQHIVYRTDRTINCQEWKWNLRQQQLRIKAHKFIVRATPGGVRLYDALPRNSFCVFKQLHSCDNDIAATWSALVGVQSYGLCQTQFHVIGLTRRTLPRLKDLGKLWPFCLISLTHLAFQISFPQEAWRYHWVHVERENLTMFV